MKDTCIAAGSDEERAAAADLIWNVRKSLSKGLKLSGGAPAGPAAPTASATTSSLPRAPCAQFEQPAPLSVPMDRPARALVLTCSAALYKRMDPTDQMLPLNWTARILLLP